MLARASGPRTSGSVGTSRHPKKTSSFSVATRSITDLMAFRRNLSRGMKTCPTPGRGQSSERHSSRIFHGISLIIPAPSPETESPPHPPLCSMQVSAARPSRTTLFVPYSSVGFATNPTPQASRSLVSASGPSNILLRSLSSKAMLRLDHDCERSPLSAAFDTTDDDVCAGRNAADGVIVDSHNRRTFVVLPVERKCMFLSSVCGIS
mmetsp:Transcript_25359/g.59364  ORF Transcript_25359/g.59364 Transcript_25359/m.59364 type:complete len:207 (+) Transcript_25359:4519-5139(+)